MRLQHLYSRSPRGTSYACAHATICKERSTNRDCLCEWTDSTQNPAASQTGGTCNTTTLPDTGSGGGPFHLAGRGEGVTGGLSGHAVPCLGAAVPALRVRSTAYLQQSHAMALAAAPRRRAVRAVGATHCNSNVFGQQIWLMQDQRSPSGEGGGRPPRAGPLCGARGHAVVGVGRRAVTDPLRSAVTQAVARPQGTAGLRPGRRGPQALRPPAFGRVGRGAGAQGARGAE